jgi:hypothetical protein
MTPTRNKNLKKIDVSSTLSFNQYFFFRYKGLDHVNTHKTLIEFILKNRLNNSFIDLLMN